VLLRCALLALLCGCPGPQPAPQCAPQRAQGDLSQSVALIPIALDPGGTLRALHDGDSIVLQRPPQGGYVLYAGAAARNVEACGATLTAQLIDPASGAPMTGLDQRRTDFVVAQDGYFWPANGFTQTGNIPACPDLIGGGVLGRDAILRVDVTDANARGARAEVRVKAVCPGGDSGCACLCGPAPGKC
jgi:hypothetical protein